jgi:hypothetical protein
MRIGLLIFLTGLLLASAGFSQEREVLQVNLIMSVDWEGFSLDAKNIEAFQQFRNDYPDIKIIHFLNAAYFTKAGADTDAIAKTIRSVFRSGDEFGLHVHAFESLLNRAGVDFRDSVTYWGATHSKEINGDRGHDVSLSLFNLEEMRKIIRTSLEILEQNGFTEIRSFRAGGWIATPTVLEALHLEGIQIDSSAVSPAVVGLVAKPDQPLFQINQELWPDQTPFKDEPYLIKTKTGVITEFPDNVALADYVNGEEAFRIFEDLVMAQGSMKRPLFFHFGFHQETAFLFLPRVRDLLYKINQFTQEYLLNVKSVTFKAIPTSVPNTPRARALSCAKVLL